MSSFSYKRAWKLSRFPYAELVYRSSQLISSPTSSGEEAQKRIMSMLRGSRINKFVYTSFI